MLTTRDLPRTRDTVEFFAGDLARLVNEILRPRHCEIWFSGGGIRFFEGLDRDVALHLAEVNAYRNGVVELRYDVRR